MTLATVVIALLGVAIPSAAGRSEPEVGVSVVDWDGVRPRVRTALGSTGKKVAVFGGVTRDDPNARRPYGDGGLFEPRRGTWTPIPKAPFSPPLQYSAWVWTGDMFVVIGSQCTKDAFIEGEYDGCARSRAQLATYSPSERRWRTLPVSTDTPQYAAPVMWSGREAWFGRGGSYWAVNPKNGRIRALPGYPGDSVRLGRPGDTCVAGHRVAVLEEDLSPPPDRFPVPGTIYVLSRDESWSKIMPPESLSLERGSEYRFACTRDALLLAVSNPVGVLAPDTPRVLTSVWRYNFATQAWNQTSAPPPVSGEQPFASGHGTVVDFWAGTKTPGARYDTETDTWSAIAAGPRLNGDAESIAWVDDIAVTWGLAPINRPLVRYRPK
jgi:hypothetical protein